MKYERITPLEGLKMLLDNDGKPVSGLAFSDNGVNWNKRGLRAVDPAASRSTYLSDNYGPNCVSWYPLCARIIAEYGELEDGTPVTKKYPLPEGWEIVPEGELIPVGYKMFRDEHWFNGKGGFVDEHAHIKNEIKAFARRHPEAAEHYPEICATWGEPEAGRVAQPGEVWKVGAYAPGLITRLQGENKLKVHVFQSGVVLHINREMAESNGDTFLAASVEEYYRQELAKEGEQPR